MAPPADRPDTLEAWCTPFEREDLEREALRQQLKRARHGGGGAARGPGPSADWLRYEAAERRVFERLAAERRCYASGGGEGADSASAAGGSDAGSSATRRGSRRRTSLTAACLTTGGTPWAAAAARPAAGAGSST